VSAAGVSLPAAGSDARPSLARLTLVELRKMVDTRSGLWLIVSSVVLTAAAVALFGIFAEARDIDFAGALEVAIAPGSVLLPILGVLLMTSEWTQRTAMITFALVPQRSRVVAAKLAAGVLLAVAVMAVCLPAAAIGTAFAAPDAAGTWSLSAELLGRITLSVVISMLMGLAFGALLLNSAAAIVLYFVLPLVTAALGAIPPLRGVATWLDPTRALAPLTGETMSGAEWAHAGTTLALWLGVPLLVGAWRIARGEIR
jgi:hypothetical protein